MSAEKLLNDAVAIVARELQSVERAIIARLNSEIKLIKTLGIHITNSGGKRMRPLILLLTAAAASRKANAAGASQRITLAAVIELIHTATLLHDDVVDASSLRRGRATANQVWGNEASVLVGDFLYSRAFEMLLEVGNLTVMRILATTTNAIAEGEIMQLVHLGKPNLSEKQYMETIRRKTAKLFESAAQIGGVAGGDTNENIKSIADYGLHLGLAFQLVDDIFDYTASSENIGKNIGDDLAEGKLTLPLIHAQKTGSAAQRKIIKQAVMNRARDQVHTICEIVESTGALDYTHTKAKTHIAAAKESLTAIVPSKYKDALLGLAEYAIARRR